MISDSLAPFVRPIIVAAPDDTALAAARQLRDASVGSLVVLREERVVGILTDRDLALRVVAEGRDATTTKVREIMTEDPFVLKGSETVDTAVRTMEKHGIRRLPLVDTSGRVVGIVTADDLLAHLGGLISAVGRTVSNPTDSDESR